MQAVFKIVGPTDMLVQPFKQPKANRSHILVNILTPLVPVVSCQENDIYTCAHKNPVKDKAAVYCTYLLCKTVLFAYCSFKWLPLFFIYFRNHKEIK